MKYFFLFNHNIELNSPQNKDNTRCRIEFSFECYVSDNTLKFQQ